MNLYASGLISCCVALMSVPLSAQIPQSPRVPYRVEFQEGSPIAVSIEEGVLRNEEKSLPKPLLFKLTNTSQKEIVAYVVAVKNLDARTGKGPTNVFERTKVSETGPSPFAPGRTWRPHRMFPALGVTEIIGRIDYVLFADGSRWGPDTLGRSASITAYLEGARDARRSMQILLEKEGPAALEGEVRKAKPEDRKNGKK
jgi:hypothetical protein